MRHIAGQQRYRVLFVDDETRVLDGLRRMLRPYEREWDMEFLSEPREAISAAECKEVDLIVSDARMPGMSGVELLSEFRQRWPQTARILLTGQPDLELARKAVNEGEIYRFLTKPCPPADLISALCDALELTALRRESARMLHRFRGQSAVLAKLEARHPGIACVQRDASGAVIVDEEDLPNTVTELLAKIRAEIDNSEKLTGGPDPDET